MADFENVVVNGTAEQLQKIFNAESYSTQNMNQYGIRKAGFLTFQQSSSNSEDDIIHIFPYLTEKNNESRAEYGILEFSASPDLAPVLLKGIKDGIDESDAATVRQVNQIKAKENSVLYTPQELTEEEKSQARKNIGAMQNGVADTNLDMQRHGIDNASHITLSKKLEVEGADVYTAFEMSCGSTGDGHGFAELSDINGDPVRITGVADGTTDSDVATFGQLFDAIGETEQKANRVTTIYENADDDHYPTAKAVYDFVQNSQGTPDETEQLAVCHSLNAPSSTDFSYTERQTAANATNCYVIAKQSVISGGLLAVNFDANAVSNFDINLYLFDSEGNAYKHSYGSGVFDGELSNPDYCDPGAMAGFGIAVNPFTVQIPEGCTVMACMRGNKFVSANGSVAANDSVTKTQAFANWAVGGGITFTVTKEGTDGMYVFSEQGEENANRYMVTDENGNVVPGAPIGEEKEEILRASINPNILSLGHRGCGIAPENTLAAFRLAKKMGFDAVETDVAFTSDGVAVLLHDKDIDRTSNGTGNITDLTFEQVRTYDFGSWKSEEYAGEKIPTFEEFMTLCKQIGLTPYIELKSSHTYTEGQITELVNVVKRYGMADKVAWVSGSVGNLQKVKNAYSKARLGLIFSDIDEAKIGYANSLKTDSNEVFISASKPSCTDEMVQLCIDADVPLMFWGIDTVEEVLASHPYAFGFCNDSIVAGVELYKAALNA